MPRRPSFQRPIGRFQVPYFPLLLPDGKCFAPTVADCASSRVSGGCYHNLSYSPMRPSDHVVPTEAYRDATWAPSLDKRSIWAAHLPEGVADFMQLWNGFASQFGAYISPRQTFDACYIFLRLYREIIVPRFRLDLALHLYALARIHRLSSLQVVHLLAYADGELDAAHRYLPESTVAAIVNAGTLKRGDGDEE